MRDGALAPYELSLRAYAPLSLISQDGRALSLDVVRWLAPVDAADRTVLDRCTGPVLDVGCGPGRFVRALAERSVAALGVDIAETAVALTRGLGVSALRRSIFDPLPGEGRWPTVLLMDGNIGIGADPARLIRRARHVLCSSGRVIVEADADDTVDEVLSVRFAHRGGALGPEFGWARVGLDALRRLCVDVGCYIEDVWSASGRTFALLATPAGCRESRATRSA
ncbi:MAG: class I SAM-dependent methyltransferase [Actinomycetota bacterium]